MAFWFTIIAPVISVLLIGLFFVFVYKIIQRVKEVIQERAEYWYNRSPSGTTGADWSYPVPYPKRQLQRQGEMEQADNDSKAS